MEKGNLDIDITVFQKYKIIKFLEDSIRENPLVSCWYFYTISKAGFMKETTG